MAAGAYPSVPRPACRPRVMATYSSAGHGAVKLASLAYPASNRALRTGLVLGERDKLGEATPRAPRGRVHG